MRAIPRLQTASVGDLDRLCRLLCAEAPELFAADAAAVLVDDGWGKLRVRAAANLDAAFPARVVQTTLEMSQLGDERGEVAGLAGIEDERRFPNLFQDGVRTALWVQVRSRGWVTGALVLAQRGETRGFSDDDRLYAEVLAAFLGSRIAEFKQERRASGLQRALTDVELRSGLREPEKI